MGGKDVRSMLKGTTAVRAKPVAMGRACRRCFVGAPLVRFSNSLTRICTNCDDEAPKVLRMRPNPGRSPKHLAAVRKLPCCLGLVSCHGPIHAHHVRTAATSGTGLKPSDYQTVPLCERHHREIHNHGSTTFAERHEVDLLAIADMIRGTSPHASA